MFVEMSDLSLGTLELTEDCGLGMGTRGCWVLKFSEKLLSVPWVGVWESVREIRPLPSSLCTAHG